MMGDAHDFGGWMRRSGAAALLALLVVAGCGDGFDLGRQPGLRGSPCDFQEDCLAPAVCATTTEYQWNICTGTVPESSPCLDDAECRFERKDGLPLACLGGKCAFPAPPSATTKDAAGGD